jgi:hypothetical protein
VQVEKGSTVIDAIHLNPVIGKGLKHWWTPYAHGNAQGKVRVPTHMILMAGFSMPAGQNVEGAKAWVDPAGSDARWPGGPLSKKEKTAQGKWGPKYMRVDAVAKRAVVTPDHVHAAIMDELDTRSE